MGFDGMLGVVGAGIMGSEIAWVGAAAGGRVVLVDAEERALRRAVERIREIAERRVSRGRMTHDDAAAVRGRIVLAQDYDAFQDCDAAVEAVPEIHEVKAKVLRYLDETLPVESILATNTSGLSITSLGAAIHHPTRLVGLHFFNPASVMRLVEVVRGRNTSDETATRAVQLARELGKVPVLVGECPGFLVNRVLTRAMVAAYRTASEHDADRAGVDQRVVANGPAPMGPFALGDLIGLDTLLRIQRDLIAAYGDRFDDGGVVTALVASGRLGRKTGAGLLSGEEEPVVGAAAERAATAYYNAARDEAERCVCEGVAVEEDVDRALRLGAGWEAGPLHASR